MPKTKLSSVMFPMGIKTGEPTEAADTMRLRIIRKMVKSTIENLTGEQFSKLLTMFEVKERHFIEGEEKRENAKVEISVEFKGEE